MKRDSENIVKTILIRLFWAIVVSVTLLTVAQGQ